MKQEFRIIQQVMRVDSVVSNSLDRTAICHHHKRYILVQVFKLTISKPVSFSLEFVVKIPRVFGPAMTFSRAAARGKVLEVRRKTIRRTYGLHSSC